MSSFNITNLEDKVIYSSKPYIVRARDKRGSNLIITSHYIWKQEWQDRKIANILWNAWVFSI